jgi:hypothetical protein
MEPTHNVEPRLYIIMREDLWDMNPGKGMAQAAHAQADFDSYVNGRPEAEFYSAVQAWKEDRSFGTTLVLSATLKEMDDICDNVMFRAMTTDPTYPYRNWYGKVFVREEITCMWAFVWIDEEIDYMRKFKLHQ